jgi:hypothetical protein
MVEGYDEARIGGSLYNFTSSIGCELSLSVSATSYELNGHSIPLLDPINGFVSVCMDPSFDLLQLNQNTFNTFVHVSGGTYNSTLNYLTYAPSEKPSGNLTITLSNSYITVIPTPKIFKPFRMWNDKSQYILNDSLPIIAMVSNLSDGVAPFLRFGLLFMTINYIIVNYANLMYQMAPVN